MFMDYLPADTGYKQQSKSEPPNASQFVWFEMPVNTGFLENDVASPPKAMRMDQWQTGTSCEPKLKDDLPNASPFVEVNSDKSIVDSLETTNDCDSISEFVWFDDPTMDL